MDKWKAQVHSSCKKVRILKNGNVIASVNSSPKTFAKDEARLFAARLIKQLKIREAAEDSLRKEVQVLLAELGVPTDREEVKAVMDELRKQKFTPKNIFNDKKQMGLLEKAVKQWVQKNYSGDSNSLRKEVVTWFAEKGFSLERSEIKEVMDGLRKLKITPASLKTKAREFNNAMNSWKRILFAYSIAHKKNANLTLTSFLRTQLKRAEQMIEPSEEPVVTTEQEEKEIIEEDVEMADPIGTNASSAILQNRYATLQKKYASMQKRYAIEIKARRGLAIVNEMIRRGSLSKKLSQTAIIKHVAEIAKLSNEEITRLERKVAGQSEFKNVAEAKKVARSYRRKAKIAAQKALEAEEN
ncbi:MAG: hypothetical protein WC934_15215, partial [Acidithiobacillus sp.]|uniref:hypothetical protein n=1 Tax=Acidithiobacillus sp. TaxID=1872118 RepID=UPI00355DA495